MSGGGEICHICRNYVDRPDGVRKCRGEDCPTNNLKNGMNRAQRRAAKKARKQ